MRTQWTIARSEDNPITLGEWLCYAGTRKDIEVPDAAIVVSFRHKKTVLKNPGFARWMLPGCHGDKENGSFSLRRGSLVFEYPGHGDIDDYVVSELRVIAKALNARLIGMPGEKT